MVVETWKIYTFSAYVRIHIFSSNTGYKFVFLFPRKKWKKHFGYTFGALYVSNVFWRHFGDIFFCSQSVIFRWVLLYKTIITVMIYYTLCRWQFIWVEAQYLNKIIYILPTYLMIYCNIVDMILGMFLESLKKLN